jgi:Zn-dependent protease
MHRTELRDLVVAYLTISLAFAIILGKNFLNISDFAIALPISLLAVGTGFILHELAHRQAAKHFGAHAEFRAWPFGLALAIIMPVISLGNFLFAAPGAVYISGENIDRRQNGIISLAGPIVNIAMGIFFFCIGIFSQNPIIAAIAMPGMMINIWLGFFNMLPIPPLDGSKVLIWNPLIWAACFFPLGILLFFPELLPI